MIGPSPSFAGQLLVAMPALADPNFWRSVVVIGLHSPDEGAFGLVINRPLEVGMEEILSELGQERARGRLPEVLSGGPVEPTHGFVLFEHDRDDLEEGTLQVHRRVAISGSIDVLGRMVRQEESGRYHLLLGYAGWAPGQLEQEIEDNSWLVTPMESSILFDVPFEDRWGAALRAIGIDPGTLVDPGLGGEPS